MKRIVAILIIAMAFFTLFSPWAKAEEVKNFLKVNEPKDKFMTSSDKVLVSGETVPESNVVVIVNGKKQEKELAVGAAGIFMAQVPITSKDNIITVKTLFPSGDKETVTRRVYKVDSESEMPELGSLIQTLKSFLILK